MPRMMILGALALALAPGAALAQGAGAPVADPVAQPAARPQPVPPQAFRTPEEGFAALIAALRSGDDARTLRVLGAAARRLIRSGDAVADRAATANFLTEYDTKSEIRRPDPNRAVLWVGQDDWELPIPMIRRGGSWRFDAREGAQILVDRRVGRNELDTIETLRAIVDAQDEYARTAGRQGAFRTYARRFFSTPGTRDGLYWATDEGEQESPLGPLAAAASAGGYSRGRGDVPRPYHGYVFRMLDAQGPNAPGGAMDYVVNGRMIGGFGVIAVPAQYGASGIQTFIVSHQGDVYQSDLGPDSTRIAAGITAFDPGPGWEKVPE